MQTKNKLTSISELDSVIDDLPVTFRKMGKQQVRTDVPMEKRLFTEWSSQYNAETYCLRSFKPVSKIMSKIDPNVKSK